MRWDCLLVLLGTVGSGLARKLSGLNALANCGYLPRSGKGLDLGDVILAADAAWQIDPQTVGLVTGGGIISGPGQPAKLLPRKWDLRSVGLASWGILHDCSLTRPDRGGPATGFFQPTLDIWKPALTELQRRAVSSPLVDVAAMAAAKAARIDAGCNYTVTAGAHGSVEIGMLLCALGGNEGKAKLEDIRALLEDEVIVPDEKPRPDLSCNVDVIVGMGVEALASNPRLGMPVNGNLSTAGDIRGALGRADPNNLLAIRKTIMGLGFPPIAVAELEKRIRANGFAGRL
ncbi:hypothetical protein CP533_6255 [Ophiocordyceps camponoti-saundersi (nom. inval.)]|nr:hypothetical protein CP533_6255 [Ophiocordyceps camponoti-saundersi (nom. inval.)]